MSLPGGNRQARSPSDRLHREMVQAWQREPRPGAPLPDQSPQSGRGQGLLCCLFLYKVTSIIFEFKREFKRRNERVPTARNVTYLRFRTSSENMISYWWMKEIYSKLPYHYKKNLKGNSYLSKYSVFIPLLQTSTPCTPVCGRGWLPGGSRPSWLRPSSRSFIMSMRWKKHIETQHSSAVWMF